MDSDSSFKSHEFSSDQDLFIRTYEKPTQIYRYLMFRNKYLPLFLQRNLSYMRNPKKKKKQIKPFVLEDMLKTVSASLSSDTSNPQHKGFRLKILGIENKDGIFPGAQLNISLISFGRRFNKVSKVPTLIKQFNNIPLFSPTPSHHHNNQTNLNLNPSEVLLPGNLFENLNNNDYFLFFKVFNISNEEPNNKKQKVSSENCTPKKKRRSLSNHSPSTSSSVSSDHFAELQVNNKSSIFLLPALYLLDLFPKSAPSKTQQSLFWQTVSIDNHVIDEKPQTPQLNFKVESLDDSSPFSSFDSHVTNGETKGQYVPSNPASQSSSLKIYYQFLLNNKMRQHTEARNPLCCPWCLLSCPHLHALLSHLRASHPRFNFCFVEGTNGGRIDVTINEGYDGSYAGNPNFLHSSGSYSSKPVKRMSHTETLVFNSKRKRMSDGGYHGKCKPIVHGHTRLYYHTKTCQPINPLFIGEDSEDENDPFWLQQKTKQMIDEFMDVNSGEKDVMKIWNLHVMKHNYIADSQMTEACLKFIDLHGDWIREKKLEGNLILHISNLFDFNLISSHQFCSIVAHFLKQPSSKPSV